MKYLMSIYGNERVWNSVDADEFAKLVGEVDTNAVWPLMAKGGSDIGGDM